MRTLTLSGKVEMENGGPLNDLVQVELVCNGRITQQTLTAPDGSFSFEWGSPRSDDWLDPGVGGSSNGSLESVVKVAKPGGGGALDEVPSMGHGQFSLTGCEVRASPRPGLSSTVIRLRTRSAFDNPDLGVVVLRRLSDVRAVSVSMSTLSAPKGARNAFEQASRELTRENPDTNKVEKELQKAIRKYPKFSAAWDLLGRVQMSQGNSTDARQSFLRAIEEEPKFIQPYLGLIQMAVQRSDWSESAVWTAKILELDSGHPLGLYWNGLANYHLKQFEQGEKSLSRLHQSGHTKEFPFALLPLGVIHAVQGKFQSAAEEFELYLQSMPSNQVPEAQRVELQKQLALWESQGLASLPQKTGSSQNR